MITSSFKFICMYAVHIILMRNFLLLSINMVAMTLCENHLNVRELVGTNMEKEALNISYIRKREIMRKTHKKAVNKWLNKHKPIFCTFGIKIFLF